MHGFVGLSSRVDQARMRFFQLDTYSLNFSRIGFPDRGLDFVGGDADLLRQVLRYRAERMLAVLMAGRWSDE
nr:hypothetical protein [uncultured Duganella sp.]